MTHPHHSPASACSAAPARCSAVRSALRCVCAWSRARGGRLRALRCGRRVASGEHLDAQVARQSVACRLACLPCTLAPLRSSAPPLRAAAARGRGTRVSSRCAASHAAESAPGARSLRGEVRRHHHTGPIAKPNQKSHESERPSASHARVLKRFGGNPSSEAEAAFGPVQCWSVPPCCRGGSQTNPGKQKLPKADRLAIG